MKRIAVCFPVFFFVLLLTSYAYTFRLEPLQITSAIADLEADTIHIYGLNFGQDPEVRLEDPAGDIIGEVILVVELSQDDYIEALLPEDLEPGTYRPVVDKSLWKNFTQLLRG